jgi:hypothetical protein
MRTRFWVEAMVVCLGFALQAYGTISGPAVLVQVGTWLVAFAKTFLG